MNNRKKILKSLAKETTSKETVPNTYSEQMRQLNKDGDYEKREKFMKCFKETFDRAMNDSLENHQEIALLSAKKEIDA